MSTAWLWLAMPTHALAAFRQDTTPLPKAVTDGSGGASTIAGSSGAGTIARTIVGLAVVLGVVYGLYWLLKSAGRGRTNDSGGRIEVVATAQLAPNRTLHLLRCGDEMILVGAGESGVTPLRVYSHDDALAAGLLDSEVGAPVLLPAAEPSVRRSPVAALRAWTVRT
ncbi:MAG TPA: flagellar biosynthetic protein FliO [Gaiellales bacterium]|nr:flagellar biosynthetic protein FliO [Gaiellales bacterium]